MATPMQEVSRDIFYDTMRHWEFVPFCQQEGLIRLQSGDKDGRVRYFLDDNIGCAAHVKQFLGLTLLMIPAECLKHKQTKHSTFTAFYEALKKQAEMIEINNPMPYNAEYEVGLRQAGYLRPVGSFSFALTNMVDLKEPLRYNENWRRNLKQSEAFPLSLERIETPTDKDISDWMVLYQEMSKQKGLSMPFTPDGVRILLTDSHFRLVFLNHNEQRVAGIIYHHCHEHAGLLYAATSEEGNHVHAGFALYQQLLTALQEEGVLSFDMEKMAASTHSTNAVFHFKQGIRGELTPLCGEWAWYKRLWMGIGMYFIKKYLWKKVQA